MTCKTTLMAVTILLTASVFYSCDKDKAYDDKFCSFITSEDYDGTGPLISSYLKTLKKDDPAESLNKLKGWLEERSCVGAVTIICNSCILTYPAQSELSVDFLSNGQTINKTMDISMAETLSFIRYH